MYFSYKKNLFITDEFIINRCIEFNHESEYSNFNNHQEEFLEVLHNYTNVGYISNLLNEQFEDFNTFLARHFYNAYKNHKVTTEEKIRYICQPILNRLSRQGKNINYIQLRLTE